MTEPAPYQRIANDLRAKILSGELGPGDAVPSENALAATYGHNRATANRAIELLRSEGLITTTQGARSRVKARPRLYYTAAGDNFRDRQATGRANDIAEAEAQGAVSANELLAVEEVPASAEIAERLRIGLGDPVIVRRMLNRADGAPMKVVNGYYRRDFAAKTPLAESRKILGGVAQLLEAEDGPFRRVLAWFEEDLELRMPMPPEAEMLRIPPGVPLARILRTLYDTEGEALEMCESLLPGDRYMLKYKIPIPNRP